MNYLEIIVPVKNEATNIRPLVQRLDASLKASGISYTIIFVDDRSTDDTALQIASLADEYPIIIHRKIGKPGKAFCILEGVHFSSAEYVAMIDADLQYPPEVIPEMFKIAPTYGVVIANRKIYKSSLLRRFASRANAFIFGGLLFGFNCDIQSGLKLFRREIIAHVDQSVVGPWSLDIPLLAAAKKLGFRLGSLDILFERRESGESKINFLQTAWEIASGAVRLRLKQLFTFPLKTFSARVRK